MNKLINKFVNFSLHTNLTSKLATTTTTLNDGLLLNSFKKLNYLSPIANYNHLTTANSNRQSILQKPLLNVDKQIDNCNKMQIREFKAKIRLRKRCRSCYFYWLNSRLYVGCKTYPSHKQYHKYAMEKGYDHLAHGYVEPVRKGSKRVKIETTKAQPK